MSDGEDIVERAGRTGRILMVGHILHYHPAVVAMKRLILQGEIGTLRYIYSNRLNIGRIRHEENILWSFAPHDISLILALTGSMPERVFSHGGVFLPHAAEDVTLTFFSFPGTVKAHVFVSWLNPFKEQKFVVIGEKKMAVFDDTLKQGKLVLYEHKISWSDSEPPTVERAEAEEIEIESKEPLMEEALAFIRSCTERIPPLTDGREALRVLSVLDAAEEALRRG
jgi:UDP-2-acetamido-3-amino-2,3-dideoxy-glucuronate N-acetyltransferase